MIKNIFIILKGLSVPKNCLRLESAHLSSGQKPVSSDMTISEKIALAAIIPAVFVFCGLIK